MLQLLKDFEDRIGVEGMIGFYFEIYPAVLFLVLVLASSQKFQSSFIQSVKSVLSPKFTSPPQIRPYISVSAFPENSEASLQNSIPLSPDDANPPTESLRVRTIPYSFHSIPLNVTPLPSLSSIYLQSSFAIQSQLVEENIPASLNCDGDVKRAEEDRYSFHSVIPANAAMRITLKPNPRKRQRPVKKSLLPYPQVPDPSEPDTISLDPLPPPEPILSPETSPSKTRKRVSFTKVSDHISSSVTNIFENDKFAFSESRFVPPAQSDSPAPRSRSKKLKFDLSVESGFDPPANEKEKEVIAPCSLPAPRPSKLMPRQLPHIKQILPRPSEEQDDDNIMFF